MSKVTESITAPERELPAIEENTPVGEVFHQLAQHHTGTFILLHQGHPTHYVQGREVAKALFETEPDPTDSRTWITVADLRERGVLGRAMVPIDFQGFGDQQDVSLSRRGVTLSVPGVQSRSWLEALIEVQPPLFLCTNPRGPHKNNDWNNGRCSQCPFPINSLAD